MLQIKKCSSITWYAVLMFGSLLKAFVFSFMRNLNTWFLCKKSQPSPPRPHLVISIAPGWWKSFTINFREHITVPMVYHLHPCLGRVVHGNGTAHLTAPAPGHHNSSLSSGQALTLTCPSSCPMSLGWWPLWLLFVTGHYCGCDSNLSPGNSNCCWAPHCPDCAIHTSNTFRSAPLSIHYL